MSGLRIVSTGRYIPEKCITNDDMKRFVDTSDEWIRSRTGIVTRYHADGEKTYEMATKAAKKALEGAKISYDDISLCIVATVSGDYATPSVACMVQRELSLREDIPVFDINAACSGFIYALGVCDRMLDEGENALIIGCERLSKILDFTDRSTCVLFGDGAGAAVVKKEKNGIFYSLMGATGNKEALFVGGVNEEESYVHMNGAEVFRFATGAIEKGIKRILEKANMSEDDIDMFVCHQANARIISHVQRRMHLPKEKMFMNLQKYGNTSGASIPIALDELFEQKLVKEGMKIIAVGFGGGLTWGSCLMEL
ncbi:MAG: ketoacyl-ACP synthase III [Eubacterium sp.]|nr:ketoacyl-ACP synthase III [Eubacterium sp.]